MIGRVVGFAALGLANYILGAALLEHVLTSPAVTLLLAEGHRSVRVLVFLLKNLIIVRVNVLSGS